MRSSARLAAVGSSAFILTVAGVVPAASGIAARTKGSVGTQAGAFPVKLVGTWTRKVTSADVKRTSGYGIPPGTVCTLTIKKNGAARLGCTNIGGFDGTIVPASTNRVRVNLGILRRTSTSGASRGDCSPSRR